MFIDGPEYDVDDERPNEEFEEGDDRNFRLLSGELRANTESTCGGLKLLVTSSLFVESEEKSSI